MNIIKKPKIADDYMILLSYMPESLTALDKNDFKEISLELFGIYDKHVFNRQHGQPMRNALPCTLLLSNMRTENKYYNIRRFITQSWGTRNFKIDCMRVFKARFDLKQNSLTNGSF